MSAHVMLSETAYTITPQCQLFTQRRNKDNACPKPVPACLCSCRNHAIF